MRIFKSNVGGAFFYLDLWAHAGLAENKGLFYSMIQFYWIATDNFEAENLPSFSNPVS